MTYNVIQARGFAIDYSKSELIPVMNEFGNGDKFIVSIF
jgi:hypothetical protein